MKISDFMINQKIPQRARAGWPLVCYGDEIVWVTGNLVEVQELPTIAGPNASWENTSKKINVTKLQVEDFKIINFPNVSISEDELFNYLENNDAKIQLEFENPTNKELNFKVSLSDWISTNRDFQYVTLQPLETRKIEYILKTES